MLLVDTFLNQVRSQTAVALEAPAHTGQFASVAGATRNAIGGGIPARSALADPALLATGGRNPNAGLASGVMDFQGPLGFEFDDVVVGNDGLTKWVHNDEIVLAKHELRAKPERSGSSAKQAAGSYIGKQVTAGSWEENRLAEEYTIEGHGNATPNEIALWAEHSELLHKSIIAGAPAGGEGK